MQSKIGLICALGAGGLLFAAADTATAGDISTEPVLQQRFVMRDHMNGNARPPVYSLRVDNMFGEPQIVTFSSEANGASTFIDILRDDSNDQTLIHIHGTLYGGVDNGGAQWAAPSDSPTDAGFNTGLYEVDFVYSTNVFEQSNGWTVNNGDDDNFSNSGTLRFIDGSRGQVTSLSDRADLVDGGANRFLLLADGHRMGGDDSSWVGRGWFAVNVEGKRMPRSGGAQDWLFRAEPNAIPLPTTAALAGVGLVFVGQRRRR